MVESSPSRQRRPACKTNKGMSDEAADAAALTYLLTPSTLDRRIEVPVPPSQVADGSIGTLEGGHIRIPLRVHLPLGSSHGQPIHSS